MVTTRTKVSLAAFAYRTLSLGRRALGKGNQVQVRRGGFQWSLDLSEGIDFSIYLLGGFEKSTSATLRQLVKPGDTAFDIGANIGAHTLGLACSVGPRGHVFAFEPTDFAFTKLQANLALNPGPQSNTRAYQTLLTDAADVPVQKHIYASWPLEDRGAVHAKHRGQLASTSGASADTLDRFVERHRIDRVDLIKIDVDGHELPVLRGGLTVLTRLRPRLVMEMSPYIHAEEQSSFADLIRL